MEYLFVIPETYSFISGGNLFNQKFIEALRCITKVEEVQWENIEEKEYDNTTIIFDSIYIEKVDNSLNTFVSPKMLLVHHLDIFYEEKNNQSLIKKRMEQLQLFDYFMVTGEFSYDWLLQSGIKAEQIFLVTPIIEIPDRKTNSKQREVKRIIMVGNLITRKGYLHFLKLLNEKKIPNIKITILGDETIDKEYAKKIRSFINASEYLNNTCRIEGTVAHELIEDYYEENDLLISSSLFETFGIAIHEALHYGLRVLALKGGNIAYMNHPLLLSFDRHEDMVAYLSEWIKGNETWQIGELPFSPSKTWKEHALLFHTQYTNRNNSIALRKGFELPLLDR